MKKWKTIKHRLLAFLLSIVLIVVYDRRMAKKDDTIYTITGYAADTLLGSKKRG